MRTLEIESLAEFDRRVAQGAESLRGWHFQSVDLTGRSDILRRLDVTGAVFLGCRLAPDAEDDVRRRGALVFPSVPDVPFDPYRGDLYTPDALYAGLDGSYADTPDARIYAWSSAPRSLDRTLAAALHDHAIDDALEEYVGKKSIVGVMGGHALERGEPAYRDAARLGQALAQAHTVATGGGPGAMEAANLGAFMAHHDEAALDDALGTLAGVPSFTPDIGAWAQAAFDVRLRWPHGKDSLGIPTWFYGHEPPNAFAGHIAKYFTNAVREDVLLRICRAGIVYLPGAAGTVQEIFQTACENYYADATHVAPMVLVGTEYWTETVPAWPLLTQLAESHAFGARLHLVDDLEEVAPRLGSSLGG
ncbi:MAG: Rossmann fold nucleotide-binding protein [Marmoricola sp.]|nr:Rossmann fold nucleotide-binding protein [Marmoricola sp.]